MIRTPQARLPAVFGAAILLLFAWTSPALAGLPSWKDGGAKSAIVAFVEAVTTPGDAFVAEPDRVAVFDNDGTLWSEQPLYTEFLFSMQRAAELARNDPALAAKPAVQAILSGDHARIAALSEQDLLEIMSATHGGLTTEEFADASRAWLASARDPRSQRPYTESVYQPMLELMDYLRAHGFDVFIVSGGDRDFIRVFSDEVYNVPADQVIGSSNATDFVQRDDRWVLVRKDPMSINDKAAKPQNIALQIGRRPIFAAGNSDGDLQMLQYATSGPGRRMGLLVHHDDADREYAYDRNTSIGRLDEALNAARPAGWVVVSMRDDWGQVFPAVPEAAAPDTAQ